MSFEKISANFNHAVGSGIFPDPFKKAYVNPIFKKLSPSEKEIYRSEVSYLSYLKFLKDLFASNEMCILKTDSRNIKAILEKATAHIIV